MDELQLELRYKAYIGALRILNSSNTSVAERKAAIQVRDEFESDLRNEKFKLAFDKGLTNF